MLQTSSASTRDLLIADGGMMKEITIFLASSKELSADRIAFAKMISELNEDWRPREIRFRLVHWEDFIDAMAGGGLQNEYNKAAEKCDIFVMLFFTKVGPYTLEEFETAIKNLAAGTGPKVYTYFRNDYVLSGDIGEEVKSLLDFKVLLQKHNHYPTYYQNSEHLQLHFRRQLEKLYGGDATTAIADDTPQSKIGEIALILAHRQLFGDAGTGAVDPARLATAIRRSSRQVRTAVLNMAQDLRRETWFVDKHQMERTIPVLEALVQADPTWHAPYGNLGYALKDKFDPDYERALESLTRAVELRGDRDEGGAFYQYSRADCLIHLDKNFKPRRPAETAVKEAVLDAIRSAKRDLGASWEQVLQSPDALDIRTWLELNKSSRQR